MSWKSPNFSPNGWRQHYFDEAHPIGFYQETLRVLLRMFRSHPAVGSPFKTATSHMKNYPRFWLENALLGGFDCDTLNNNITWIKHYYYRHNNVIEELTCMKLTWSRQILPLTHEFNWLQFVFSFIISCVLMDGGFDYSSELIIRQNWLLAQYFNYSRTTAKYVPWLSSRQKF